VQVPKKKSPASGQARSALFLGDVEARGCLDTELVHRLRQKESLGSAQQKIVSKIQQNEPALRIR